MAKRETREEWEKRFDDEWGKIARETYRYRPDMPWPFAREENRNGKA